MIDKTISKVQTEQSFILLDLCLILKNNIQDQCMLNPLVNSYYKFFNKLNNTPLYKNTLPMFNLMLTLLYFKYNIYEKNYYPNIPLCYRFCCFTIIYLQNNESSRCGPRTYWLSRRWR